jgi:multicomponent Na+:H+ antiporter subunit G
MRAEALRWVADALVLLGLVSVTVSVVGMVRMPSLLMRVHAAGQAVLVGVIIVLMGAVGSGQGKLIGRALLVAVFLLLTAPMSAHAIARAAVLEREEEREGRDGPEG